MSVVDELLDDRLRRLKPGVGRRFRRLAERNRGEGDVEGELRQEEQVSAMLRNYLELSRKRTGTRSIALLVLA